MGSDAGYCIAGAAIIAFIGFLCWLVYLFVVNIGPYVVTAASAILLIVVLIGILLGIVCGVIAYIRSFIRHVYDNKEKTDDDGSKKYTAANEVVAIIILIGMVLCAAYLGVVIFFSLAGSMDSYLYGININSIEDFKYWNAFDNVETILNNIKNNPVNIELDPFNVLEIIGLKG